MRLVQAEVTEGPSNFDLILSVTEFDRSLQGRIVYNSELFEEETIARIVNHFRILLSSIVADPSQCYWELPLMTEQEMSSLPCEWNATAKTSDAVRHIIENEPTLSAFSEHVRGFRILGQHCELVPVGATGELYLEVSGMHPVSQRNQHT